MEIESVVVVGFFDLLGCRFEELGEPLQQTVGRFQDLVGEGSGVRVRSGAVELVGEYEDLEAVGVMAGGIGGGGDVRGRRGGAPGIGGGCGQRGSPGGVGRAAMPGAGLAVVVGVYRRAEDGVPAVGWVPSAAAGGRDGGPAEAGAAWRKLTPMPWAVIRRTAVWISRARSLVL